MTYEDTVLSIKRIFEKESPIFIQKMIESIEESIEFKVSTEDPEITDSKLGGIPYLPMGFNYPLNKDGHPLALLAQINFSDFEKTVKFPHKGMLQFFIDITDVKSYGADFRDHMNKSGFKVVYHEEVALENMSTDYNFLDFIYDFEYPIQMEVKLKPKLVYKPIHVDDYRFRETFLDTGIINEISDEFYNLFYNNEILYTQGNRLGGYPNFIVFDIRNRKNQTTHYNQLLFQLESEYHQELGWVTYFGAGGIANFFINEQDLLNLDFSNVFYTWDHGS